MPPWALITGKDKETWKKQFLGKTEGMQEMEGTNKQRSVEKYM